MHTVDGNAPYNSLRKDDRGWPCLITAMVVVGILVFMYVKFGGLL